MEPNYLEAVKNLEYEPEFVFNGQSGRKVLTEIEKGLLNCDRFDISVAFITDGGIEPLLPTFKQLEEKNIKGRILTTDYLTFTDPKALRRLHEFKNLEIKMFRTDEEDVGFHTKGYIFEDKEVYHIIVGSSNITQAALTKNKEWNIKINIEKSSAVKDAILDEFEKMWNSDASRSFEDFIDDYVQSYQTQNLLKIYAKQKEEKPSNELKPNSMQEAFIDNLEGIVADGKDRALLISATGTGKTYASAFAMKHFNFKRVLFLVHRNQLATQAQKSYQNVFGNKIKTGIIGDGRFESEADYIFGTVNTIYKTENIAKFRPNDFDCIVIDEAHHSCASMYQKIMDYFKPKLWLGMTATPDRVEAKNQENIIYKLFDYQIAYEIRLQQAMKQGLLCPFHYFGISDLQMVDDETVDENTEINFNQLTSDERVRHIINESKFYGYSGNRVKGLIFCNRIEVAKVLSRKFNELGYNTISLDASASEDERQEAFDLLATDEQQIKGKKHLDYIFSVNLLNEGVDIVEVNQVIMLRRTQSPIVFLQQLGRGLRKHDDKEYVVVLDFIGNYKTNFVIPIALSGDRTYNKDNIRRFIAEGTDIIPGASTIHFDEISQKRIYKALDDAEFNEASFIYGKYLNLKSKVGRVPTIKDFEDYGELDIMHIVAKYDSYHAFLTKKDKQDYKIVFSDAQVEILKQISRRFMDGKRPDELEFFDIILNNKDAVNLYSLYEERMLTKYGKRVNEVRKNNIVNIMTGNFETTQDNKAYKNCIYIEKYEDDYKCAVNFKKILENLDFVNNIKEIIRFGLERNRNNYSDTYKDTDFVLYKKYSYYDACRLLNWSQNGVSRNIGGYFYDENTKTFPVFINYVKDESISESTKYEDRFINPTKLISLSKPKASLKTNSIKIFLDAKEKGISIPLFIRKKRKVGGESAFYFLGEMNIDGLPYKSDNRDGLEIPWKLVTPVKDDIYDYIVNK